MYGYSICTCGDGYNGFYHDKPCPYYFQSTIEFLNGSITIDTCNKCFVLVPNFTDHWKAVHDGS